MGLFSKKSKNSEQKSTTVPKKTLSPVSSSTNSRYVSPTLEKIPSDLSKNQVPSSPRATRQTTSSSLRALPPSPNRIQSPYAQKDEADPEMMSVEKEDKPSVTEDIVAASTSESHTDEEEDEEMVMVRPRNGESEKRDDDVSDVNPVDTGDEQSEMVYGTSKNNSSHLNSLFNGHLMKWKFDAEEGPGYIRIPAFLSGLGLIGTTTAALVLYPVTWTISSIVISVFVYIIAIAVVVLDGRFLSYSPLSIRAHLRNVITRHFGIFRYLWGRGILYLAGAVLSASLMIHMTMISGAVMFLVSVLAIFVGSYSSRKFAALRHSLSDESFLLLEFSNVDYDDDGYINPSEFASLLTSLGMELDDRYCLKAFNSMDTDHDRRISFEEFCHWWSQGYIERGRKPAADGDEESYHRFV
ncbi:expressed unknown protein [Seminavis robusta]|uniref:EF-hand domain-containing protein n=1 Tax=Seminavis robusta TaxID=568900 RepID=A0A9N8F4R9_9STRA|nr:expressed unknown protein [Seminavis robusta]|eukprot:Sro2974_g341290.1 n/a (411) ;mRNA; r:3088-4320